MPRRKATASATHVQGPGVQEVVIPSIGSAPLALAQLTPEESIQVAAFKRVLSNAIIGDKNPMWNDREELELAKSVSFTGGLAQNTMNINDRFAKRHTVADMNIPRNPVAMIQLSLRYAAENPFVAKALRVKTDFTVKDFKHQGIKKSAVEFFDNYALKLNLKTQLRKIVWNLYAVGLAPIYWGGEDGGPIQYLQIIDPCAVHVEDILGRPKMWLKITAAMISAMRDPLGKENPVNKAQYDSMPEYWRQQIREVMALGRANGLIELKDGSYTVVENRYVAYNRQLNTLDGIPLQGAFDALQRYRLLAAGDFAVAWNVKNMLTLISEGDPKMDPKNYKPADTLRLAKLQQQFSQPDYALTIYCDPTTQVRYVVPPLEVFDPKKYEQVEKEIKDVMNLPSFMWNNKGTGAFGAAMQEVQLLRQEVDSLRLLLEEQFFRPLYTRLRGGVGRPGFAAKDIILPQFDQNSLRDDTIWLGATKELYGVGALSLKSLMEVYGFDFDYEIAQKKQEHKDLGNTAEGAELMNNTPARPLYEPSQGNLSPVGDKGGRPEKTPGSGANSDPHRTPRRTKE